MPTVQYVHLARMEYAPFLALAFADVLDADNERRVNEQSVGAGGRHGMSPNISKPVFVFAGLTVRPDIATLRVRAKAAMANWSPSRRLTSLTGETLEQVPCSKECDSEVLLTGRVSQHARSCWMNRKAPALRRLSFPETC